MDQECMVSGSQDHVFCALSKAGLQEVEILAVEICTQETVEKLMI